MLNRIGWGRHLVVGASVVVSALLGTLGVVGAGDQGVLRGEHFDAKQITVRPDGADGVRIREVVDIDFGFEERRGYQRIVPNDFGTPIDVVASSPDANDEVDVIDFAADTRIRIGNPSITFTGQRRYVLEYTLPDARVSSGDLALDIIGTDETFDTDRFEVILIGFGIDDAQAVRCDVGRLGTFGGCDFDEVGDDRFSTVIEPLAAGSGLTVSLPVGAVTMPEFDSPPPLPTRTPTAFPVVGLTQLVLGAATAGGVFAWFRRRGSNEVFGAGGAADAAFAPTTGGPPGPAGISHELPVPVAGDWVADVPTYRVPDSRLGELATVEFVPPRGVAPWQGNVLLSEKVGDSTVSAWFSEMVARGAIEIHGKSDDVTLQPGQTDARLSAVDRRHLSEIFRSSPVVALGTYDSSFAGAWKKIRSEQERVIAESGWWKRSSTGASSEGTTVVLVALGIAAIFVAAVVAAIFGALNSIVGAALLSVGVALWVAGLAYGSMLASRTATGSALTLRTESFRRFLDASEGRHVDWAWEQGVIREYSAWAVALGAAEAWSKAIESSNIDQPDSFTTPMLLHTYASTISSTRVAPSTSSGGGGGGGFSGGSVGGGGGGGSSGSW